MTSSVNDSSDTVRIVMPVPLLFTGIMQRIGWEQHTEVDDVE